MGKGERSADRDGNFSFNVGSFVIAAQLQDVRISEGDQYLLHLRNLPGKVQEFL